MKRIIGSSIAALIVAAGLILGGLMGYLPNLFPNFVQEHPVRFWTGLVGLVALLVGYAFAQYQTQTSKPAPVIDLEQAQRNRQAMLEKVRLTWIAGVLDQSVAKEAHIALDLEARPDAVIDPVDLVVQRPGRVAQQLPPGTQIREIYNQLGGALLILGAPGAGKTTLLLELTRDLLDRATGEPQHPIPIVFPLSTWVAQRLPLAEWLVDELILRYQVPRKQAQFWIDADAILALLDGLDEVTEPHRNACVDAINAYRQTRGHLPLVVSSRIHDYEAQTIRLQLHGAILAQPLDRGQVRSYLRAVGVAAIPTRDSPLWELLDTPLMLTVAALAYAGQPLAALPADPVAARTQLFATYIDRMFERNNPQRPFTDDQTRHYLAYLAHQMQQHNQTVLYLENLQPDWLPARQRHQWRILVSGTIVLVSGLVVGLGSGLVFGFGLDSGLAVGLVGGLVVGLVGGLVVGLLSFAPTITPTERLRWSWMSFHLMLRSMGGGLIVGLVEGLLVAPSAGLVFRLVFGLVFGLVGGLISVLVGELVGPLVNTRSWSEIESHQMPNQVIRRSVRRALVPGLSFGLVFGLLGGLVVGLINGLLDGLINGLAVGLLGGLVGGLVVGLLGGQLSSAQASAPTEQSRWSWMTFRATLRSLLVGGLVFGLLSVLLGGLVDGLRRALVPELSFGLVFRLLGGLVNELRFWLVFGLVVGLLGGLVVGLLSSLVNRLSQTEIESYRLPNQAIHRSIHSAFVAGLSFGLVFGLVFGLLGGLLVFGLVFGLFFGLLGVLLGALQYGGLAYIQHYVLRLLLIRTGSIPGRLVPFLDYATQRIFLRRVGGGYLFIHGLLLEHFAAQYIPPHTTRP